MQTATQALPEFAGYPMPQAVALPSEPLRAYCVTAVVDNIITDQVRVTAAGFREATVIAMELLYGDSDSPRPKRGLRLNVEQIRSGQ